MNFEQKKNTQESMQYPEIAREMAAMKKTDQEMRAKLEELFRTTGKTQLTYEETGIKMEDVDVPNTKRMKEIVSTIGWPTESKVGKQGAQDAWLLVQHADLDPVFQRQCLDLMIENIDDVPRDKVAYLTDRVEVKEEGKQTFGTQWWNNPETGEFEVQTLKYPEQVDELRAEYNLDSLEEYKKRFNPEQDNENK